MSMELQKFHYVQWEYSTAQTQLYKRVLATRERLWVTQQVLASHSCVFYATHASEKGVNCTVCGSEISCASNFASASEIASASSIASASKIASASTSRVRVIFLILITIVI